MFVAFSLLKFMFYFFTSPIYHFDDKVSENSVRYYLHLRNKSTTSSIDELCTECPIKMIIHGWSEDVNRPWYKNITREYLKKGNYNVILVDWSKPASENYLISSMYVKKVGAIIGKFIAHLCHTHSIPLANIHIVSHSLGVQVAGRVGQTVMRLTGKKVNRITALDTASPFFETLPIFRGLQKEDAEIVDAIHTDGGGFGYSTSHGHVDFYLNGGVATQPGCPKGFEIISLVDFQTTIDNLFCSHTRSYAYFIRSINEEIYLVTQCPSLALFETGYCVNNRMVKIGDDNIYGNISGNFFGYT